MTNPKKALSSIPTTPQFHKLNFPASTMGKKAADKQNPAKRESFSH
ncbi:hypothetical protein BVRB_9g218140 [Beta vulgaris subsp. vulgaris]|nr:hypothetical protein BVRB_9g218140 [Beta vulgaris subsp. vulgaris]